MILLDFITRYRKELIERTRRKVVLRAAPRATSHELNGIPLFLTQLATILEREAAQSGENGSEMGVSATQHGSDLLKEGFSIAQVVHDYGDICQSISDLSMETESTISTEDFRTLNRCLDDAIAGAVTEFAREQDVTRDGTSNELENLTNAAITAFEVLQTGDVGVGGSTGVVLHRSLLGIRAVLADRRSSEVVSHSTESKPS